MAGICKRSDLRKKKRKQNNNCVSYKDTIKVDKRELLIGKRTEEREKQSLQNKEENSSERSKHDNREET